MNSIKKKKAQFDFVWLFAIIAGASILVLAIYGVMKYSDTKDYEDDTKTARSFSSLLDALQQGYTEGSSGKIVFKQETKIINDCLESPGFGENRLSVSTKSDIGEPWGEPGEPARVKNKYIFSSEQDTGKTYYLSSKTFDFPYKVNDLIFITSQSYCFIGVPENIEEDLLIMGLPNFEVENCTKDKAIKVCFGQGSDCDIKVNGDGEKGTVTKSGKTLKYQGNLMYAAIFSDKAIYDCNVERLMYRTSKIAEEFSEKADLMNTRDCNTNLKQDLESWKINTMNATSEDLFELIQLAENLDTKNDRELCGIWD